MYKGMVRCLFYFLKPHDITVENRLEITRLRANQLAIPVPRGTGNVALMLVTLADLVRSRMGVITSPKIYHAMN